MSLELYEKLGKCKLCNKNKSTVVYINRKGFNLHWLELCDECAVKHRLSRIHKDD